MPSFQEPLYCGSTSWGPGKVSLIQRCPHFRGMFMLRKHIWVQQSVLNTEVSFQGCPLRGVPLYLYHSGVATV